VMRSWECDPLVVVQQPRAAGEAFGEAGEEQKVN
jgi:hypothetical protein